MNLFGQSSARGISCFGSNQVCHIRAILHQNLIGSSAGSQEDAAFQLLKR